MCRASDAPTPHRAVLVMNPRSGGGKVEKFRLRERAELLGAQVLQVGPGDDPAALARGAAADGADVLGAAGGDGTVSSVAAVAAETGLPLVVLPAGTRNHFARDLGLDTRDPSSALQALRDGEKILVDLGFVGDRAFVNTVSFGAYADALLSPGYREAKARALASAAGPYLAGRQWVDARVDTPGGTIERPEIVLISNNPYHLTTPRYLGRRFALDAGVLGGIAVRHVDGPVPPPPPARLRPGWSESAAPPDDGLVVWSAPRITLDGAPADLAAGVDGEAVRVHLPVTCEIRPEALSVVLPRDRPGTPPEPQLLRLPAQRPRLGAVSGPVGR